MDESPDILRDLNAPKSTVFSATSPARLAGSRGSSCDLCSPDLTAPEASARSFTTGQESPVGQRWGSWYVTANSDAQGAMANVTISDPHHPEELARAENAGNLRSRVNATPYLTGSSDIVALMVLANQTQMHNLITTNYQTRFALYAQEKSGQAGELSYAARKQFEAPAEQLVRYPLEAPIVGTTTFAAEFTARGPRDSQGRSLRDSN